MRLAKFQAQPSPEPQVGAVDGEFVVSLGPPGTRLCDILHAANPESEARRRLEASQSARLPLSSVQLLPPIDGQEVWGAGVTYLRSKVAREEESERAATFYDMVYTADRPELFFKATPSRVVGPGQAIRVRSDSKWCVPEPELALVLTPDLRLVGFTVGNDVSARDIEGSNPLYLPQAKVYDACCALGPVITLASALPPPEKVGITLEIERSGRAVFQGETSLGRMARKFSELVDWLGRDNLFPGGVFLLTGTGVVPPDDFSLQPGDVVHIAIEGIGKLTNDVVQAAPRD